jgi:uncharacterized protein (TIGR00730 family)
MSEGGPAVAVFGSSEPAEGEPLYEAARRVGHLLAREGFEVVTGGYGGVMEAASRGAVEAGGVSLGITSRALSPLRRAPNPYLTRHIEEGDLFERTRELIGRSAGYIILPGKAGTLAELTFLWALNRAQLLQGRPIVLLGPSWRSYLEQVNALELVDPPELEITHVAGTPEEAVGLIRSKIR